ncbi:MAG: hypothetical protein H0V26_06340, partial [Solirubrobacterales bacterium]|nr:hypothetical protein [Solirubrobacterales bacterium]
MNSGGELKGTGAGSMGARGVVRAGVAVAEGAGVGDGFCEALGGGVPERAGCRAAVRGVVDVFVFTRARARGLE